MKINTLAIIQARMGSTRLPGKSLARINSWSIIELVLERVKRASLIDEIVLATSINRQDDVLAEHVRELGFSVYRGSENDVLSRFFEAAQNYEPKTVVRVTGDCPLISPKLITQAIKAFLDRDVDYLTLAIGRDKELAYPRGFDVEVAKYQILREASEKAKLAYEREHVMPYIYTHQELFSIYALEPPPKFSRPNYRLCVDTDQDLTLVRNLSDYFDDRLITVEFDEIIRILDEHPDLVKINQNVKQKSFNVTDEISE
jgi:spore coat polysaccharide biosynthesis protein SpsF